MQQIFEFQLKCSLRIEIVKEVVHLLRTSWLLFSLKFYELRTPCVQYHYSGIHGSCYISVLVTMAPNVICTPTKKSKFSCLSIEPYLTFSKIIFCSHLMAF